jgi:hypothetical protein
MKGTTIQKEKAGVYEEIRTEYRNKIQVRFHV